MSKDSCHPNRKYHAKGMCRKCYSKQYRSTEKSIAYVKSLKLKKIYKPKKLTIPKCHPNSKHYAKGLCEKCYIKEFRSKPKFKEYINNYKQKNIEYLRKKRSEYSKIYNKTRRKADIQFKLSCTLRERLNDVLKGKTKNGSAVQDLGCTLEELRHYLESLFQPGMSWDNYGKKGWHIDHIIPLSAFELEDREQLLKACHYTNLQPLWARDNLSKGGIKRNKND